MASRKCNRTTRRVWAARSRGYLVLTASYHTEKKNGTEKSTPVLSTTCSLVLHPDSRATACSERKGCPGHGEERLCLNRSRDAQAVPFFSPGSANQPRRRHRCDCFPSRTRGRRRRRWRRRFPRSCLPAEGRSGSREQSESSQQGALFSSYEGRRGREGRGAVDVRDTWLRGDYKLASRALMGACVPACLPAYLPACVVCSRLVS